MRQKLVALALGLVLVLAGCQKGPGPKQGIQKEAGVQEEAQVPGLVDPAQRGPGGLVLSFDDKAIRDWYGARVLFDRYQARACFFLSGLDQIPPEEVGLLQELGAQGHEIGCHSLHHANACDYVAQQGLAAYLAWDIEPALEKMRAWGLAPRSFAYPYGARTEEINQALLADFDILRGTRHTDAGHRARDLEDIFYDPGQVPDLVLGLGIDEVYQNSLEEICQALDRAREQGQVLVLYGHGIQDQPDPQAYVTDWAKLEGILAYAARSGLRFYTLEELVDLRRP